MKIERIPPKQPGPEFRLVLTLAEMNTIGVLLGAESYSTLLQKHTTASEELAARPVVSAGAFFWLYQEILDAIKG